MNLHEYQGKQLFAQYGLPVSKGIAAETPQKLLKLQIKSVVTSGLLNVRYTLVAVVKLAVLS